MASDYPQHVRDALAGQTTPISARDSVTGADVPNVGDTVNAAVRVNVVAGSGGVTSNVNLQQVGGTATTVNNGVSGAGTLRVTVASDSTGQIKLAAGVAVIGALSANQSVNVAQINGVAPSMGNGISGTGVQRVTLASDSTGQVALAAGSAVIGHVIVDSGTLDIDSIISSINPGNGHLNLGKQDSDLYIAGDIGVAALGVVDDGTVVIPGINRYTPPRIDATSHGMLVKLVAGSLAANQSVNVTQLAGTAISVNNGTTDAGTQRVTLSSDSTGQVKLAAGVAVIGALSANQSVNQAQVAGTATSVNNGTTDAGTQRVTLSSDSTGQVKLAAGVAVIGALSANQSVNQAQVAGTATSVNNGTTDAGTQRVTLSSDSTGQVKLAAGVAVIGALSANQSVNQAQVAGTATSVNNGTVDAGTQRVTIASNSTGQVALAAGAATIGALTANQSVNVAQINGVTTTMGNGASGTGVQRVTIASDSTGVVGLNAGTNLIGNVGLNPRTSGGLTTFHLVSAASTNATNIKASAGQVFGWFITNSNAAARKVAFHNTAGTPTAGASIYFSLVIPANSAANVFSDTGMAFSTGIAITTVTGLADTDSTGVAVNDLIINIWYA